MPPSIWERLSSHHRAAREKKGADCNAAGCSCSDPLHGPLLDAAAAAAVASAASSSHLLTAVPISARIILSGCGSSSATWMLPLKCCWISSLKRSSPETNNWSSPLFSRQLKSLLAFRELITDLFRASLTAHYVNKERERLTWL